MCILLGLSSNLCHSAWLICVYRVSVSSYVVNNFPRYTDFDSDHQHILFFYATGKVSMLYTKSLHANPWRTRCSEHVHLRYLYWTTDKTSVFYSSCLLNLTLDPEVGGAPLVGRLSKTLADQLCSISRDLYERLPYRGAGDQQNMAQNYPLLVLTFYFNLFGFVGVLLTNLSTSYFIATSVNGKLSTLQVSLSLLSMVKMPWSQRDSARNKYCS